MIINGDTEFHGFLNGLDITVANELVKELREKAMSTIADKTSAKDVAEEVVRRNGTLYRAAEARPIAPFEIKYDDTFFARFGYLEGERRPPNPAYAEYDWCVLNVWQYSYATYLQKAIKEKKLSIENL